MALETLEWDFHSHIDVQQGIELRLRAFRENNCIDFIGDIHLLDGLKENTEYATTKEQFMDRVIYM